jgi:hypothetical protein
MAESMHIKNVSALGNEATWRARTMIEERARCSGDDVFDAHRAAFRDLSLALCEALERMHEQVPARVSASVRWVNPQQMAERYPTSLLPGPVFSPGDGLRAYPETADQLLEDQSIRDYAVTQSLVREREARQASGIPWGAPPHVFHGRPHSDTLVPDAEEDAPTGPVAVVTGWLCTCPNGHRHRDGCPDKPVESERATGLGLDGLKTWRNPDSDTLHVDAPRMDLSDWQKLRGLKSATVVIHGVPDGWLAPYARMHILQPLITDGCTVAHHEWPWND